MKNRGCGSPIQVWRCTQLSVKFPAQWNEIDYRESNICWAEEELRVSVLWDRWDFYCTYFSRYFLSSNLFQVFEVRNIYRACIRITNISTRSISLESSVYSVFRAYEGWRRCHSRVSMRVVRRWSMEPVKASRLRSVRRRSVTGKNVYPMIEYRTKACGKNDQQCECICVHCHVS